MTLFFSVDVRNARLDAIETVIGTSPILKIFDGTPPANCAAADDGDVLATLTLPSDWMAAASSGSKALSGTWQDASADDTGTATYFRIYDSGETACDMQGTCSESGGGGDMILQNTDLNAGQTFTIITFTITDGNAGA